MEKVCPWWLGYALLIPVRKFNHDPGKILKPYVKPGMNVMDYGCAMGFFSIPLAKMTGETGVVYCVDIQEKMLEKLQKRAVKHGVSDIIRPLRVGGNYNPEVLREKIDLALLFFVAHEVPDQFRLFNDLFNMLKPGGKVIFIEPQGHVSSLDYETSLVHARKAGFILMPEKPMKSGLCAILSKTR
jgi:ubiquinone/menaquinone biosynthesis C-methylase UbiE